ncbi:gliding motility-associated C-terminal domain-containing protein [[Flexibacter] sp. ATCC 35103]|uniref:gliding motility-associated C-terminal domain-containing protein n=1 Tax=[Flexibacter] sp. ATCC 35103 TaxID=1937528 RepID=UPI0009CC4E9D|nr:gliding motility-associated C-terminal domain-containing protein [[Flexibacter] sp. ATCC 35103]OMQ10478.1 hypothetical protein BXU01_14475 [[Flexibacter] sp. ATCC 35103]
MKKNDLYKVNNLAHALPQGKSSCVTLGCLLILLFCETAQAQVKGIKQEIDSVVVNKGLLQIVTDNKSDGGMYVFFDFDNQNTGELINDGELHVFKNYNNDGTVRFTADDIVKNKRVINSTGTTFFSDLYVKQLITGNAVSDFQNVVFNNMSSVVPFDLTTTIRVGNESRFENGIINALDSKARVIFNQYASAVNAGDHSFVDGMVVKSGDTEFEYPIGNNLYYRPLIVGASAGQNAYVSQYFFKPSEYLTRDKDASILELNSAEYWEISRDSGTDKIILGLTLNSSTTPSHFLNLNPDQQLAIVRWDSRNNLWVNEKGSAEESTNPNFSNLMMGEVEGPGIFTVAIVKKTVQPQDVEVFNAISPNGDGVNDTFHIAGIDKYPDNSVEIYNRWGVKVFETKSYNESDNVFTGYSDGRATVTRGEKLPTGTYFYILRYNKEGNGIEKSGYLYINNQ